tara:strand:+ start:734 stop:1009 length:276 start_codon:yes stop_codon:yes gene_type:complete
MKNEYFDMQGWLRKQWQKERDIVNEEKLTEAPMDNRFAKDFEKDCKVLIAHIKHEMKTAKGADKSVFKKMLKNLQTVAGYPALIGKMVGSN